MKQEVFAGLLAIIGMAVMSAPAQALSMSVAVQSVHQHGSTGGVYLGHTVMASTNMNRLTAGGSFTASCPSPWTPDPITGARTLPGESFLGGVELIVTIPAQLPAIRNMPGWANVPRGSTLFCTYLWSAFAKEATYTLGVPGSSMPIGGGEIANSDRKSFTMVKPGRSTGEDDACHP